MNPTAKQTEPNEYERIRIEHHEEDTRRRNPEALHVDDGIDDPTNHTPPIDMMNLSSIRSLLLHSAIYWCITWMCLVLACAANQYHYSTTSNPPTTLLLPVVLELPTAGPTTTEPQSQWPWQWQNHPIVQELEAMYTRLQNQSRALEEAREHLHLLHKRTTSTTMIAALPITTPSTTTTTTHSILRDDDDIVSSSSLTHVETLLHHLNHYHHHHHSIAVVDDHDDEEDPDPVANHNNNTIQQEPQQPDIDLVGLIEAALEELQQLLESFRVHAEPLPTTTTTWTQLDASDSSSSSTFASSLPPLQQQQQLLLLLLQQQQQQQVQHTRRREQDRERVMRIHERLAPHTTTGLNDRLQSYLDAPPPPLHHSCGGSSYTAAAISAEDMHSLPLPLSPRSPTTLAQLVEETAELLNQQQQQQLQKQQEEQEEGSIISSSSSSSSDNIQAHYDRVMALIDRRSRLFEEEEEEYDPFVFFHVLQQDPSVAARLLQPIREAVHHSERTVREWTRKRAELEALLQQQQQQQLEEQEQEQQQRENEKEQDDDDDCVEMADVLHWLDDGLEAYARNRSIHDAMMIDPRKDKNEKQDENEQNDPTDTNANDHDPSWVVAAAMALQRYGSSCRPLKPPPPPPQQQQQQQYHYYDDHYYPWYCFNARFLIDSPWLHQFVAVSIDEAVDAISGWNDWLDLQIDAAYQSILLSSPSSSSSYSSSCNGADSDPDSDSSTTTTTLGQYVVHTLLAGIGNFSDKMQDRLKRFCQTASNLLLSHSQQQQQ